MAVPTAALDGRAHNGDVPEIDPAAWPQRRRFSAEYKAKILAEYAAAARWREGVGPPPRGPLLLADHRGARDVGVRSGLEPGSRTPKRSAAEVELEKLKAKHRCTEAELARTRLALDIRGTASAQLESLSERADMDKQSPA